MKQLSNEFTDSFIDRVARVSFDACDASRTPEQIHRLVNFLVRENHWTPVAHPFATMDCPKNVLPLEKMAQDKDLMAGLNLHLADGRWVVTAGLWGWLQLGHFLGLREIFDILRSKAPIATQAYLLKKEPFLATTGKRLFHFAETPERHKWATFEIEVPLPIRTQMFKHKIGFVENEVSRRYVNYEPEIFKIKQWRGKPANAKQGSGDDIYLPMITALLTKNSDCEAIESYNRLIRKGVCPEQARFKLPQGMMTKFIWTGTKESYDRFFSLRIKPDAQLEIQEIASTMANMISYQGQQV